RPRDQFLGLLVPALLMSDHPQKMQGIDVLRIKRQHLAVEGLGLRQAPRLVVLQSQADLLRGGLPQWARACIFDGHVLRACSIETSRSPSFGRSLAGCARAGMASIARFNPTADPVVRKPRRVGFSISFI